MLWMDNGTVQFEGELIRADCSTLSGRIYPIGVVRKMLNEAMKANPLLVSMADPTGAGDNTRVSIRDACGIIENVSIAHDGRVTAKGRVLDTRKGRDLVEYLHALNGGPFRDSKVDLPVGLSIRAVGSVSEDGIVRDDVRLVGVDMVEK